MKWLGKPSPFHLFTNPCVINRFIFGQGVVIYYIINMHIDLSDKMCQRNNYFYQTVSVLKYRRLYAQTNKKGAEEHALPRVLVSTFDVTSTVFIVNNHPLTKNKPIYHARISEQMKWRGFPEPFHLFTFRA